MTEFFGHGFFFSSIVVGAIKNVTFRRILLVLVFETVEYFFRDELQLNSRARCAITAQFF